MHVLGWECNSSHPITWHDAHFRLDLAHPVFWDLSVDLRGVHAMKDAELELKRAWSGSQLRCCETGVIPLSVKVHIFLREMIDPSVGEYVGRVSHDALSPAKHTVGKHLDVSTFHPDQLSADGHNANTALALEDSEVETWKLQCLSKM